MLSLKYSNSVKHLFAGSKILTVYGLYIFKSIKYVKEHLSRAYLTLTAPALPVAK